MKLAIIRCMQTEDFCPGTSDFKAIQNKTGVFEGVEENIELIGFTSCGGCPGKRAVHRAKKMVKLGAEAISFTSCITKGTPIGFACPYAEVMMDAVRRALPEEIQIFDHSH